MHIMLDLETLGTKPGCAVLSIGAVSFNAEGIINRFYKNISIKSCMDAGLGVDASTLEWWFKQSPEAQHKLFENPVTLLEAATAFRDFSSSVRVLGIWGNGASFDNAILGEVFDRLNLKRWPYWLDRCFRTIKSIYKDLVPEPYFEGTEHNALHDAEHQAEWLIDINEYRNELL